MAVWNCKEYDFKTFIEEFPLPQVVRVIEGVYGAEDEATLSAHETLKLHMIKNHETVKATDERNRVFYLPLNSSAKVKVLPNPRFQEFYVNVQELAQDFPTYVKSIHDHSWLNIEKGDVLKLKEVTMTPHGEKNLLCEFKNEQKGDVLIPYSYRAQFKTLGDFLHSLLFLKEVVVNTPTFPVLVKFEDSSLRIKRSDINSGRPTGFDSLGAIILQEKFDMSLVIATSWNDQHGSKRTLLTIPHDLDIKVIPVLDENEGSTSQAEKRNQIEKESKLGSFRIDFNETNFKHGCNIIEEKVYFPGVKPIPLPRKRVTTGVTVTSSQTLDSHKRVNDGDDSYDSRGCHDDKGQNKEAGAVDKGRVDDDYEDMTYASKKTKEKQADIDESVLFRQQHNNEDDDDDDDDDEIPVIPSFLNAQTNQATSLENPSPLESPGPTNEHQKSDSDDDVFQEGHLNLPPIVPEKSSGRKARIAVLHDDDDAKCSVDSEGEYVCMTGGNKTRSLSVNIPNDVHLDEHRSRRETRRHVSDLGPSISIDSPSSYPVYDVPPSTSQTSKKKSKSSIRKGLHKKLTNLSRSVLKRSKSTPDIFPDDYQYVTSIPEAKADRQTEIGKFLSRLRRSKAQEDERESLSAVDYLRTLTIDEVSESLKSLNLHRYVDTFKAADIDGSLFMDLDDEILEELNVRKLDRLKIRKLQTEGWTPKYQH